MRALSDRPRQALAREFLRRYPDEAARMIEPLPAADLARLFEGTPGPAAAAILDRLSPQVATEALAGASPAVARRLLEALDPARAAGLLGRLDEEARSARLALVDPALAREIRELLAYPEESAGRLMDARVTALRVETTAREALGRLRQARHRRDDDLFVVDGAGRLTGVVALPDVALAAPGERLERLARPAAARVQATATREEVVEALGQQGPRSLPVTDFEGRLLGVIRHDALVAAAQAEATVDMQTMVGASREERALSPAGFAVRKRLPWLQINLATAFLAAAVVGLFEDIISRVTALAVLLPVVAGQSGNTGAQALAVTMRGLALREIRLRHWLRVTAKEGAVAVANGLAVALTTAIGVYVWSGSVGLTLVIGVSMVISMVAAGLSGATIPMLLTALRQDPAQSSSIILTTVTDVVGFFSFLGIATLLGRML